MYIIPAIDLMAGRCVRLVQGEYQRQIIYKDNPAAQAEDFVKAGAQWLHVVDLDGAKIGKPANTESIEAIVKVGNLKIEVGGGIRNEESIKHLLGMGVERVIIGTKAVSDYEWFSQIAEKFKGKIVLGLDAKGLKISTHGWTKDHSQNVLEFAKQASNLPLAAIIYTDISKDGMMAGPNLERTKELAESVEIPVIASGGVSDIESIIKLKELGCIEAAIVGRALYEGTLDLKEAIEAAK